MRPGLHRWALPLLAVALVGSGCIGPLEPPPAPASTGVGFHEALDMAKRVPQVQAGSGKLVAAAGSERPYEAILLEDVQGFPQMPAAPADPIVDGLPTQWLFVFLLDTREAMFVTVEHGGVTRAKSSPQAVLGEQLEPIEGPAMTPAQVLQAVNATGDLAHCFRGDTWPLYFTNELNGWDLSIRANVSGVERQRGVYIVEPSQVEVHVPAKCTQPPRLGDRTTWHVLPGVEERAFTVHLNTSDYARIRMGFVATSDVYTVEAVHISIQGPNGTGNPGFQFDCTANRCASGIAHFDDIPHGTWRFVYKITGAMADLEAGWCIDGPPNEASRAGCDLMDEIFTRP